MRSIAGPLTKLVIFVVITVAATAILGLTIANLNFSSSNSYTARFSDVTSLNDGDDVRIAGVKVGEVENISIADRQQADVKFSIESDVTLPASVTATIKFRNLVGQRYISLAQGPGNSSKMLAPGDTIPLAQTQPALDLTELFNGFQPLFQALSPDDVNQLSYEIIQVFQGEGGTIDSLLSSTASLTSTIADKDKVIGQVIDNLNSVLNTVNAHSVQLGGLITSLQQLVSGLAADRQPISDAIGALGDLANSTAGLLDQGRAPLQADIAGLGTLSKNLDDNQGTVQHFIQYLPQKLNTLIPTASYGSWFNFFLCSAGGTVTVPPLITKPVTLPLEPVTQARCKS
ncbi:MAG TPA: MCE family protein [Pseudonocardiaceae bacterium]|jgi:phospholipid/cholesterol/gamma-HCH transport system substrate-binding protein|nr:MCE family protein [Pseudonocardiaceae bacterium]